VEQIKKLAIVIPAYKGRFLKETLDSIAVQAHKEGQRIFLVGKLSFKRIA